MKFSIGIPAFKGKFLSECIKSVLNQTYKDFELIIVNDCSPDAVKEIVMAHEDYRIKYYENEVNVGAVNVVDNWNKCLNYSKGDYFILMGDDDLLDSRYLEIFSDLIDKFSDLDVFHCRTKVIDENSSILYLTPSLPEYESVYDLIWHRINGHRTQFISDFVYRTEALIAKGGFYKLPLAWASDDISAYLACGQKGIANSNEAVFLYRTNPYNISSTGNAYSKINSIELERKWFESFLTIPPQIGNDVIIYENILDDLDKYFKKRRIYTIASSLESGLLKGFVDYINHRKSHHLSMKDLVFSFVEKLRRQYVGKKY